VRVVGNGKTIRALQQGVDSLPNVLKDEYGNDAVQARAIGNNAADDDDEAALTELLEATNDDDDDNNNNNNNNNNNLETQTRRLDNMTVLQSLDPWYDCVSTKWNDKEHTKVTELFQRMNRLARKKKYLTFVCGIDHPKMLVVAKFCKVTVAGTPKNCIKHSKVVQFCFLARPYKLYEN